MTQEKAERSLFQLVRALWHPLLLFDAYTFRWLTFDPHDEENNQQQAFTKVTNVGLISALILTVFASWLHSIAATSYASYGQHEHLAQALSCAALSAGVILLVMSVINSVLLLLAVNDAEDDHHATILLRKLGVLFTLPALYFYLGTLIGIIGWFIWIPAVFPLAPSLFILIGGFIVGVVINTAYYQFIVLSVYEARDECGMAAPPVPLLITRMISCGKKAQRVFHGASTSEQERENAKEAMRILDVALPHVKRADLLQRAREAEWDHLEALQGMKEQHAKELGLSPGSAVRFLRKLKQLVKSAKKPS